MGILFHFLFIIYWLIAITNTYTTAWNSLCVCLEVLHGIMTGRRLSYSLNAFVSFLEHIWKGVGMVWLWVFFVWQCKGWGGGCDKGFVEQKCPLIHWRLTCTMLLLEWLSLVFRTALLSFIFCNESFLSPWSFWFSCYVSKPQLHGVATSLGKLKKTDKTCFRHVVHHPLFESHCLSMKNDLKWGQLSHL